MKLGGLGWQFQILKIEFLEQNRGAQYPHGKDAQVLLKIEKDAQLLLKNLIKIENWIEQNRGAQYPHGKDAQVLLTLTPACIESPALCIAMQCNELH